MRGRVTERSSILLLGRNTVVIGAVVVTAVSFGLGYFFGYKGTDVAETEKQVRESPQETRESVKEVKENPKASEDAPAGDKNVLEAGPEKQAADAAQSAPPVTKPVQAAAQPAAQPIVPPAPAGTDTIKPPAPIPEIAPSNMPGAPAKEEERRVGAGRQATTDSIDKAQARENGGPAARGGIKGRKTIRKKTSGRVHPVKKGSSKAKARKPAPAGESITKDVQPAGNGRRLYTVQMGAFPTKEGAEQLQQALKAKGYKPYVVDAGSGGAYFRVRVGSFNTKKNAEHSAAALSKQTGLQNFVTIK